MELLIVIIFAFVGFSAYCYCNCADQAEADEYAKLIERTRKEWRERKPIWRPISIQLKQIEPEKEEWKS